MTKWPYCQSRGSHDEIQLPGSVLKKHRPRRLSRESKKESQESHCSESKEAFKIENDIQTGQFKDRDDETLQ
jgi:hypothetical protein